MDGSSLPATRSPPHQSRSALMSHSLDRHALSMPPGSGGTASTNLESHVSLRYIKKMCFAFLEAEAPALADELLNKRDEALASTRIVDSPAVSGAASNVESMGVGAAFDPEGHRFCGATRMPVLEVVLELQQPIQEDDVFGQSDAAAASHTSTWNPQHDPAPTSAAVWNVPPKFQKMKKSREHHIRSMEFKVMHDASTAKQFWGSTVAVHNGETQRWKADRFVGVAPRISRSDTVERAQELAVTPTAADAVSGAHARDNDVDGLSSGAYHAVAMHDLVRRPPVITAFRLVALTDCPLGIQQRAQIDPEWLQAVAYKRAAYNNGDPVDMTDIVSGLFLCWVRLYGGGSRVQLFSDALVLQRASAAAAFSHPLRPLDPVQLQALQQPAAALDETSPLRRPRAELLPLHYHQAKLFDHEGAEAVARTPREGKLAAAQLPLYLSSHHSELDSSATHDRRLLDIVALQQLRLDIELRDRYRQNHVLPDAFSEDRAGLPRPSANTLHAVMSSAVSPPRMATLAKSQEEEEEARSPRSAKRDAKLRALRSDVDVTVYQWRQAARAASAQQNFNASQPPEDAATLRMPLSQAPHQSTDTERRLRQAADVAVAQHDNEDTFCIPDRRVRVAELGLAVETPPPPPVTEWSGLRERRRQGGRHHRRDDDHRTSFRQPDENAAVASTVQQGTPAVVAYVRGSSWKRHVAFCRDPVEDHRQLDVPHGEQVLDATYFETHFPSGHDNNDSANGWSLREVFPVREPQNAVSGESRTWAPRREVLAPDTTEEATPQNYHRNGHMSVAVMMPPDAATAVEPRVSPPFFSAERHHVDHQSVALLQSTLREVAPLQKSLALFRNAVDSKIATVERLLGDKEAATRSSMAKSLAIALQQRLEAMHHRLDAL